MNLEKFINLNFEDEGYVVGVIPDSFEKLWEIAELYTQTNSYELSFKYAGELSSTVSEITDQ